MMIPVGSLLLHKHSLEMAIAGGKRSRKKEREREDKGGSR
jgi:hypothetical protein